MSANDTTFETRGDLEIVMTRVFNAPSDLVFRVHTEADHIRKWWGQRNSTITECHLDARDGGTWRFVIDEADGSRNVFYGDFREVKAPERIVWTFTWEPMPDNVSVETLKFQDVGDGTTRLVATSVFDSQEARDSMIEHGMEAGARETWGRLGEHLATLS